MTRDANSAVDALRPKTDELDEQWSRTALATIMATPTERLPRQKRHVATVSAGVLGVVLLGAGAAAAAGVTPQTFVDAFKDWGVVSSESEPGRQAVDPAAAKRMATSEGPGDTVFSLVAAPGRDGFTCVAAVFETPASMAAPVPSEFVDANGSQCADTPPADARFGDMAAVDVQRQPDVLGARDVRVLSIWAGPASRAVIQTADGRQHTMLELGGRFYGWFEGQGDDTRPAVLIGYTEDGTEAGRTRL